MIYNLCLLLAVCGVYYSSSLVAYVGVFPINRRAGLVNYKLSSRDFALQCCNVQARCDSPTVCDDLRVHYSYRPIPIPYAILTAASRDLG